MIRTFIVQQTLIYSYVCLQISNLRERGMAFLDIPNKYYENLRERLAESKVRVKEDLDVVSMKSISFDPVIQQHVWMCGYDQHVWMCGYDQHVWMCGYDQHVWMCGYDQHVWMCGYDQHVWMCGYDQNPGSGFIGLFLSVGLTTTTIYLFNNAYLQ